jgi:hypothetical protein
VHTEEDGASSRAHGPYCPSSPRSVMEHDAEQRGPVPPDVTPISYITYDGPGVWSASGLHWAGAGSASGLY